MTSIEALPYSVNFPMDMSEENSHIRRENVFDPYGFNTILTRFVKRNNMIETDSSQWEN